MLISKELNMVFEGCEKYLFLGLSMVCVVSLSVVSELVVRCWILIMCSTGWVVPMMLWDSALWLKMGG